jgi:glycosyltransferase involved in cell wall biosynthesis
MFFPEQQSSSRLKHLLVLIPVWQPDIRLSALVEELAAYGFAAVFIIDDGSDRDSAAVFDHLKTFSTVHLLRHAVNLGKGRALKTGFHYVLSQMPQIEGVITADADGQHTAADIAAVAKAMESGREQVVLGVRKFGNDAPLRNRFGNVLTKHIFGLVTGIKISDTQTGLRAFPRSLLPMLKTLPGERYEYEMAVLAHVCRHVGKPHEIPIQTIYLDENRTSHFHPIWDSMRIYFVLVRFCLSSFLIEAPSTKPG